MTRFLRIPFRDDGIVVNRDEIIAVTPDIVNGKVICWLHMSGMRWDDDEIPIELSLEQLLAIIA